jgi:hypothetical protein
MRNRGDGLNQAPATRVPKSAPGFAKGATEGIVGCGQICREMFLFAGNAGPQANHIFFNSQSKTAKCCELSKNGPNPARH